MLRFRPHDHDPHGFGDDRHFVLCGVFSTPTPPARNDTQRIIAADTEPGSWLTHGRTYGEQRFSPLTKVSTDTVGGLGLAWTYEMRTNRGASATPLVVDGVMYATSAWSLVYALDAVTGQERWVYDPKVDRAVGAKACCDVVNRGVAVSDGKVFVGVIDGRLVALDAKTGRWFGKPSRSISRSHTPSPARRGAPTAWSISATAARNTAYAATSPPMTPIAESWCGASTPSRAIPPRDRMVPPPTRSWPKLPRRGTASGGSWVAAGPSGTPSSTTTISNRSFIGVGNGSPWNQQHRSPGGGDNWFLSSIVALDASTGAYKWHYQTTPGETWDYTATQPIILAEVSSRRDVAEGRDAGPEERVFLRRRPGERPADQRAAVSADVADEEHPDGDAH